MSDTGIAAAVQKASTNSRAGGRGKCPDCVKEGLAVLPTLIGVLPKAVKSDPFPVLRTQAGAEIDMLAKAVSAGELAESWSYLRAVLAGYLYVLKPDKTWDAYLIDSSGLLRSMPASALPGNPGEREPLDAPTACKRGEHNPVALQVLVLNPQTTPKVWIAYSRYRWADDVLKNYAENRGGCRDRRMMEIDVVAMAAGNVGKGRAVPSALNMRPDVGNYVADYASPAAISKLNEALFEPLHSRSADARHAVAGGAPWYLQNAKPISPIVTSLAHSGSKGSELARQMANMSQKTAGKTGVILALPDPVGVTSQLNWYRNRLTAELAAMNGVGNEEIARKRIIAEVIAGIVQSAKEDPGWFNSYGPDRYLKHINQPAWEAAKREADAVKALNARIERASDDFVKWKESQQWAQIQREDFSQTNAVSALDLERMVSICVCGSGLTKTEHEKVWEPVLRGVKAKEDNWFERSLSGLHTDFQQYLTDQKKEDKIYDSVKGATALAKDWSVDGIKKVNEFRAAIRAKRAANDATAALIETVAGRMGRLLSRDPEAYQKIMRRVAMTLLVRADVVPQPVVVKGPFERMAQLIMAVGSGEARLSTKAPIQIAPKNGRGPYLSTKGNLGQRGLALSEAVEGAVLFEAPGRNATGVTAAWIVQRVQAGDGKLSADMMRKFGLREVELAAARAAGSRVGAPNPWLENALTLRSTGVDAVLSAGVVFFQINAFNNALADLGKAQDGWGKAEAGVGMTTAVLSSVGAGLEIAGAISILRGVAKESVMPRMIVASRFGAVAGFIEGAYLIVKGANKVYKKDYDSGLWTIGTGIFVAVAGVSGVGAATAAATGGSVAILGLSLGPVGWALLTIALIGVSLYFAWQAFITDDENYLPVEYWLDNGVFGKGELRALGEKNACYDLKRRGVFPFVGLDEEIIVLNRMMLVASAKLNVASDSKGIGIVATYEVALPRYADGSRLAIAFTAIDAEGKRSSVGEILCEDGKPNATRSTISAQLTGMREGPILKIEPKSSVMRLSGMFATMQESFITKAINKLSNRSSVIYAERFEMTVDYWPDRNNMKMLQTSLVIARPEK
ncbi:toxin VasX [Cupriavidus alkaliphilus]|uniref:toxin VasX n=1 Tax=Cupriavidus alkaliphilus TaxID=942866 RepID=UPI00288A76A1|nr:toxin VasX [Cupriavidus alkaliphilus]